MSAEIRGRLAIDLSQLDSIVAARQYHAANHRMIVEQFCYLVLSVHEKHCLAAFQIAPGNRAFYPRIELLIEKIVDNEGSKIRPDGTEPIDPCLEG